MKLHTLFCIALVATLSPLATSAHAQSSDSDQIAALRREMKQQHDDLQAQIDLLRQQLSAATGSRPAPLPPPNPPASTSAKPAAQATIVAAVASGAVVVPAAQDPQRNGKPSAIAKPDEQASIRYMGVTITPGGFLAGESVWRQHGMNADIYTNFNGTPFASAGESHMTEWVPSARQSRLSTMISGKTPIGTLKGYFEGDFLSAGTTSNNLQSNSYTMRVRQAWAQVDTGKFVFTAGQTWSLAGENKKAANVGQEAIPLVFDGNVHVGFSYVRQLAFRAQANLSPAFTLAASLENSQYQFAATNAPANFFFGNAGSAPGLNNPLANYTNQVAPDVIVKASFDPRFGHFELGGIASWFRDRYYPSSTSGAGARNDTKFGGGLIANARVPLGSRLEAGLHFVGGDGSGRYGASLLPDITVKPDGTVEPLRNAQTLLSLQFKASKKLDLFAYAGNEYVQRTFYRDANGTLVGYAPPSASNLGCHTEPPVAGASGYAPGNSACLGATRSLNQLSVGWVYRLYSGPMGRFQYGAAYSYLQRAAWTGVGGAPTANNNLVYTSVRYYLP